MEAEDDEGAFFLSKASANIRISSRHSRTSEVFTVSPQPDQLSQGFCYSTISTRLETGRRFPPPWSVEEAALPSSPDRNVENGRGQGIPEVSRVNQPPRPTISRTPLVPVGLAASLSHRRQPAGARLRLFRGGAGTALGGAPPHPRRARRIAANIAELLEADTSAPGKLVERRFPPPLACRGDGRLWSELTSSVDSRGATSSDDNDNRNAEAYSRHQHRAASSRSLVAAHCPRRHDHHPCHGQPSLKPSSRLRATQ
jgi:hypothetical protein